jgi:hypothetical protein
LDYLFSNPEELARDQTAERVLERKQRVGIRTTSRQVDADL